MKEIKGVDPINVKISGLVGVKDGSAGTFYELTASDAHREAVFKSDVPSGGVMMFTIPGRKPTALELALRRIKIVNPPFPVKLSAVYAGEALTVDVTTNDRRTGERRSFVHTFAVPAYMLDAGAPRPVFADPHAGELLHWIADRVRAVFVHEFHECFQVDERRMYEPHPHVDDEATSDIETRYDFRIGPSRPPRSAF